MAEEDQRERFTEFCAKKYYGDAGDSCAAPRSKSISTKRGQQIINLLKDDSTVVKPGFRYWVKKKGYPTHHLDWLMSYASQPKKR